MVCQFDSLDVAKDGFVGVFLGNANPEHGLRVNDPAERGIQ
jgi:hypothetical protein